jgi:hypothetical protein
MGYTVRSGATVTAQVAWTDFNGTPAEVDGDTTWVVADPKLVSCDPDKKDSTIARLTSVGPLGTTQVLASAATKSGKTLSTQVDVHIIAAEASQGSISMTSTYVNPLAPGMPMPPPPMTGGTLK